MKASVLVVRCDAWAAVAAGTKFVRVPQLKPLHGFSSNFQDVFSTRGSRID